MLRHVFPMLSVTLLSVSVSSFVHAAPQPPEPLKFEEAPAMDIRILSEKASREPFGQPDGLPVYADLPASSPTAKRPAPRTMPAENQVLEQDKRVNPDQRPAFNGQPRARVVRTSVPVSERVIAAGLSHPWALAFMPDGRMLVTEKSGSLRIITQEGKISPPVSRVPPVLYMGDAGLLDVVTDPDFASNRRIYCRLQDTGKRVMP